MKISILTDNHAGSFTGAEHGLSYMIEYDNKRILFDTGQSDLFLENAGEMGVDMINVDTIILSHGHYDHGNGLKFLSDIPLLCHPGCFSNRYSRSDNRFIGLNSSINEISERFKLSTSETPVTITPKIFYTGSIPRITDFESKTTPFMLNDLSPDFIPDDSALVMVLPEGLFIVTGCGHSGIVNTLEHARKITGIDKLYGIMGGFHLKEIDDQTTRTIQYIREKKIEHVMPSHCTDLPALSAFYNNFWIKLVKTGNIYNF